VRQRDCAHYLVAMLAGILLLAGAGSCSLAANPEAEPAASTTATPTINPDELNTVQASGAPWPRNRSRSARPPTACGWRWWQSKVTPDLVERIQAQGGFGQKPVPWHSLC